MAKSNGGHRNGSPDAADTLTPTRLAEIGGSIPISQVQELRKIPSALPSLFPPSRVQNYFLDIASPTSLRLTWDTPASNGGSTLLGYKIRVVNQETSATVYQSATYDSSPFTATGLTTGVSYQVRVAPVNAIGQGEEDYSDSIPGATIPEAPTGLSATAGNGTAALSWTAPANDGGGEITGYVVEYTPAGGFAQTSGTGSAGTTFTLNSGNSAVERGVTYSVRVAAANAAGMGPYSSAVSVALPTVPGAPTALAGTAGNAQVPLTWTAPASNGGSAITGYVVEWTPSGGSAQTVNTGSATASYTKTALTNGTAVAFRVAAINSIGTGPWSSSITVTPVAPSGATFTALSVGSNAFGRTLTGVGTSTATMAFANTSGFENPIAFTVSEPCIMLWRGTNGPADRQSSFMLMDTTFQMLPGQYLEKSGYYRTEITIYGRYNHFCYPLPQAGTYRLSPSRGLTPGVEATISLVTAPAILYASANAASSGRRNFWTHSSGKEVTWTCNSFVLDEFTFTLAANATVTITRTANPDFATLLESNRPIPGAELDKYGTYARSFAPSSSSVTSSLALLAGNYKYARVSNGTQVTFSIP
jgi:hypothetical protein